jgi:hypothetical protein
MSCQCDYSGTIALGMLIMLVVWVVVEWVMAGGRRKLNKNPQKNS